MIPPRSTYRLQLRPSFRLAEAAEIVPYLADLGVSHLYLSPIIQARAGSEHGYDVVDHSRISEELGGETELRRLAENARAHGLGLLVDIVPNHMAIDPANKWWWDVLESGHDSRYALYFDVSWDPPEPKLKDTILLPVLTDHYGRELEEGSLRLARRGGRLLLDYGDQAFPVAPETAAPLLSRAAAAVGSADLADLAQRAGALVDIAVVDAASRAERHAGKEQVLRDLSRICDDDDRVMPAIDREVARLNGDVDALDALISVQHYRLAYWRTAARELDYRRFFDINDLVALRVEESEVFDAVHERIVELVREGLIDGVRVDHVDGLRDPAGYLERLRETLGDGAWILVEKILHADEHLRASWPVDGATGYEAIDRMTGVFMDPAGEDLTDGAYRTFTGERRSFDEIARDAKLEVMRTLLVSDVERVTALLVQICEQHRRHRDHTRSGLRDAVREVAASLAVYRTYARPGATVDDEDRRWVDGAFGIIRRARPDLDAELLRFLRSLLLLEIRGVVEEEFVLRFQQLTAPVAAKGVEDTALYRYGRLVARNDVGSDPGRWSVAPEELHRAARAWLATHRRRLVASSTHDTKRSEDVRARSVLLSEMPEHWTAAVERWSRHNERYRSDDLPDREDELLLYQTLVGAHPLEVDRALAYMEKAAREAKRGTSWTSPDERYERALARFVRGALSDPTFTSELDEFVRPLIEAGRINSLAQTLLKLTVPGVADIYQGTELWDFSLVDPDNRRPVDFSRRRELLGMLERLDPPSIASRMDEGLPKLHVIRRALAARARHPEAFAAGEHRPLPVSGAQARHAIAFQRGDDVAVVVPRLVLGLYGERIGAAEAWGDTTVELPEGSWCDEISSRTHRGGGRRVAEIMETFPVALLVRQ